MKDKLTIVYYTSNYLEDHNPYFLKNTTDQLVKAADGLPIIVVSHKPVDKFPGHKGSFRNIVMGQDYQSVRPGRHHLNIYQQLMIGAQHAATPYVAAAEDDILYSHSHFHSGELKKLIEAKTDKMLYDMNKVSLFTWTEPPIFSFRSKRMVVNQLIAPTKRLAEALQERFKRLDELLASGWPEERILKFWGDLGRYEKHLGVTEQPTYQWYSQTPSIVFTHPDAYGYLNHGKRKRHGDIKIIELLEWGKASDILKLWKKEPTS